MKKLLAYLVSFIKDDFSLWVYSITFSFLALAISINYSIGFEKKILNSYYHNPIGILYCFLFYASSYYLILFLKLGISSDMRILKSGKFWVKSLFFLGLLAVVTGYNILDGWGKMYSSYEHYYIVKIAANLRFIVVFGIPILLCWKIMDKQLPFMYGLFNKNFDKKPYLVMLLIMLPLVIIASFQQDFLSVYPKLKPWFLKGDVFGLTKLHLSALYEFTYGLNFVGVELFFRGALVIGMVALLGRHVVLPMAVVYCLMHFGKPVAECVSSFFGGYLLGVVAMYTRSILGGFFVHIGIAYLMEAAALMQYYFVMKK